MTRYGGFFFKRKALRQGALLGLLGVLVLTYWVYVPGLAGEFLFDDFVNLDKLGTYGGVVDVHSFKDFVLNGDAGPLGRPISLASFLLDDNTWPSQGGWFKPTNLKLHLLTGLLLCWATLLFMRAAGVPELRAQWVAVLSSGIWLVHPFMVSTTLYVVQRMAQLSTLFVFAGIVGYLHGRSQLLQAPVRAYIWMTLAIGLGTCLAVFSKENGVLLPLLVLVIEICLPFQPARPRPDRIWTGIVLGIPALMVLGYLLLQINFSPNLWPERIFDQRERLLTEPRILLDYLYQLYVPRIEGRGLFQDGFTVSRSLNSPWTTLPALLGVCGLILGAFLVRKGYHLVSLAILFFFAAHLIESTVIGLELYFEHRNYMASAFLFLPLASGLLWLGDRYSLKVPVAASACLFALLLTMTYLRSSLWADVNYLQLYWAEATPNSARAQSHIANHYFRINQKEAAIQFLEEASHRLPDSALLTAGLLLQKVGARVATHDDFTETAKRMSAQPVDAQAVMGLRTLTENLVALDFSTEYRMWCLQLIRILGESDNYKRSSVFERLSHYLNGLLFLSLDRPDLGYQHFTLGVEAYHDVEAGLMMVSELGKRGQYGFAKLLLKNVESVYAQQSERSMRRSKSVYDKEILRLKALLNSDSESI